MGGWRMAHDPHGTALWAPFVDALPVDGGSISVISRTGLSSTVSTSSPLAAQLDALQLQLGEGPRWTAFQTGAPVLVPDVDDEDAHVGWPLFGVALAATPARGVFSFPLVLGLLIVGVADLYSDRTGDPWSAGLLADATALAAASAAPAVRLATRSASAEQTLLSPSAAELRREVHQATGMLVVQLDVRPDEALARLQAHAFSVSRPLLDVARDVVGRRLDLGTGQE